MREVVVMWLLIVVFVVVLGVLGVWREYRYQKDYKPVREKHGLAKMTKERLEVAFQGTGSSMIAPLYGAVRAAMATENFDLVERMQNYTPTSSEAGLRFLRQGKTTWASSEYPLPLFERFDLNVFQFPVALIGLAVTVNLPGMDNGTVRLSRQNLVDIFQGKIKSWNDPLLVANNPGLKLPALSIVVLLSTKGSGANYILTNYLSEISDDWKDNVGKGLSVNWPTGIPVGTQSEVIDYLKSCKGGICYVESSEAERVGLNIIQLENISGQYILPNRRTISSCMVYFDVEHFDDYSQVQASIPGEKCYPLVGMNYAIIRVSEKTPFRGAVAIAEFWECINLCFESNPLVEKLGFHSCFVPRRLVKECHDRYCRQRDLATVVTPQNVL